MDSIFEIQNKINQANRVFLTAHQNCPDAIGSLCAFDDYLKYHGKHYYPFLMQPVPRNLQEMSGSREIKTIKPNLALFDLFLIVDAGDLKQTGLEKELTDVIQKKHSCIVNIDHHKTNDSFGNLNIVDPDASSTCELIYQIFQTYQYDISSEIAECLLTGIIGDTGNFTNAATNQKALEIAADLVWRGGNIFHIIQRLYSTEESINTLRLWGRIFQRLTYNPRYDIAISYVLQKDFAGYKTHEESVEVVANFLNYISGIKAGVLLKEKPDGSFKVSLRSTYPKIDVSILAKMLGGGGHRKAAGFSIDKFKLATDY